jgi:hypothetical protein
MHAFREAKLRRAQRQTVTMARAMRAGRARAKTSPPKAPRVHGTALRELLAEVAAEAHLVDVPVNRAPWATTGLQVAAGEDVTWLAWGMVNLIKPLGIVAMAHQALAGRVGLGRRCAARATP